MVAGTLIVSASWSAMRRDFVHTQKAQEGRQARASDAPLTPEEEAELVEQQETACRGSTGS